MSDTVPCADALSSEQDVCPCKHMETMVSGLADGSLRGPGRWYTQLHAMHCKQCRSAVAKLRTVIGQVADLRDESAAGGDRLPTDRREDLERALDAVDSTARKRG